MRIETTFLSYFQFIPFFILFFFSGYVRLKVCYIMYTKGRKSDVNDLHVTGSVR